MFSPAPAAARRWREDPNHCCFAASVYECETKLPLDQPLTAIACLIKIQSIPLVMVIIMMIGYLLSRNETKQKEDVAGL